MEFQRWLLKLYVRGSHVHLGFKTEMGDMIRLRDRNQLVFTVESCAQCALKPDHGRAG